MNFKWYGYGSGGSLCWEGLADDSDGEQGVYKNEITVTLSNGCVAKSDFEVDVDYDWRTENQSAPSIQVLRELSIVETPAKISKDQWFCSVTASCPDNNCLAITATVEIEDAGQYQSLISQEESFHQGQFEGTNGTWGDSGSYVGPDGARLTDTNKFLSHFVSNGGQSTATGLSASSACSSAREKLNSAIVAGAANFTTALSQWTQSDAHKCWIEFAAKRAIGWDESKAGGHYDCGYVRRMGCPQVPKAPTWFWDQF